MLQRAPSDDIVRVANSASRKYCVEGQNQARVDSKMDNQAHSHSRWGSSSVSMLQHWLLHAAALNPTAPVHTTVALELLGPLNRRALRDALDRIVCHHQILRTAFRQINGEPTPVIGPADRGLLLIEQDVDVEESTIQLFEEETRSPFDISNGPLIRARLLQRSTIHHFLFVSAHPLVCDRSSYISILIELRDHYDAFSRGKAESRPRPPDTAANRQFHAPTPDALQEQLTYWKRQLLGAPDLARLPTDRPRRAALIHGVRKLRFDLPKALTDRMNRLAARRCVSLLAVLLCGWSVLLSRWCAQQDLTTGVLVSNRPPDCEHALIGPVENILPIRVLISPNATIATLLARIDASLTTALANRDVPMHAIADSLRPLRCGRPIVQTTISLEQRGLETVARGSLTSGDLKVGRVWQERCESALELSLSMWPANGRLVGVVEYAQDLFEERTVARVCDWLSATLSAMVDAPGSRANRLSVLSTAEWRSVVFEFNDSPLHPAPPQRIDDMFESIAERIPDAAAVVDESREISFLQLNGRANQLARILKRRGTASGELIAIPSKPGLETIVAAIAVLKARAAYVAVAPADIRVGTLRAQGKFAPRTFIVAKRAEIVATASDARIIAFDDDADEIAMESTENVQREDCSARDLACVILEIGRRGHNRWTLLEHRNVTSMLASIDERLHLTAMDTWSLMHTVASGSAQLELWGALLYGSQVMVTPAMATRDPETLYRCLAHNGITVLNLKPSEFLRCLDTPERFSRHRLHTVILSGEQLRTATLRAWFDRGQRWPRLIFLYGSPGFALAAAYTELRRIDVADGRCGSLGGEPLSCCSLYILDRYAQPVPFGVVGEIYTAGDGVARGYIEGRRRGAWVPAPLVADIGAKLYRTGEQGQWTAEGRFYCAPRMDATNSSFETFRIESELLSHPAVKSASVVIRRNDTGDDTFVAYVEASRRTPSAAELRTYLESHIPAYLVPAAFVFGAEDESEPNLSRPA